ncbi:hypothetical protein JHK85_038727 [Glycine max]|nr:hypothetical protein JHK85_038727 [Glycine max]
MCKVVQNKVDEDDLCGATTSIMFVLSMVQAQGFSSLASFNNMVDHDVVESIGNKANAPSWFAVTFATVGVACSCLSFIILHHAMIQKLEKLLVNVHSQPPQSSLEIVTVEAVLML